MRLFRSLLLIGVSIAVLSGLVYMAHGKGLIPKDSVIGVAPYLATEWISNQVETFVQKVSPTANQVQEVASQSGVVLGEFIQVNEKDQEKKLHERTLEFAQYTYCKQVVEQWEENQNNSTN